MLAHGDTFLIVYCITKYSNYCADHNLVAIADATFGDLGA